MRGSFCAVVKYKHERGGNYIVSSTRHWAWVVCVLSGVAFAQARQVAAIALYELQL